MKISRYDRVQALHRKPEHRADVEAMKGRFSLERLQEYNRKWGVSEGIVIDDELATLPEEEIEKMALFMDETIVKVIPHESTFTASETLKDVGDYPEADEENKTGAYSKIEEKIVIHIDRSSHLRDERFLTIEIDLSHDKKAIEAAVKNILDLYWERTSTERKRSTTLDRWRVYDMYKAGHTLRQIVQTLVPDADEGALESLIQQAWQRYQDAEAIINSIHPAE